MSVSQFTVAGLALAQFGIACSVAGQFGPYVHQGRGRLVRSLAQALGFP